MITPAFAQTAAAGAGPSFMSSLILFLPLILIWYFLLIKPQQKKAKQRDQMVAAIRKGDQIITGGGILGKVTKAVENSPEIEVEIADGVRIKLLRSAIGDVRNPAAQAAESK